MRSTGIIFAALDCDLEVVEQWNRWYDLEHTPPNLVLDGVMLSNRYVATPDLIDARTTADGSPFAGGRAAFITIYTLAADPKATFDGMSGLREQLIEQGRMAFPDDRKIVREGDVMSTVAASASDETRCPPDDAPFVGHTGLVLRQRRGGADAQRERVLGAVSLDGVHAAWTLASQLREGLEMDLFLVEGDAADAQRRIAAAMGDDPTCDVSVTAAFERIVPLRYPWADAMRASSMPQTIA
jgi:hypothetical protein